MKNLFKRELITFIVFLFCFSALGQVPEKMSYQAVIRDSSDQIVSDQEVGMRISILQGTTNGSAVYVETQNPFTNDNGLISLEIGEGTVVSGDFAAIDWADGPFFIKTETDLTGGTSYSITGTSQLLSVPYALYSKSSGSSIPGPQGEPGPAGADGHAPDGTIPGQILYWNGSEWINLDPGSDGQVLTLINGIPTWHNNGSGNESWFEDVINPATGKTWMDRNLGATQAATSSTDEASYGDLYQWGRGTDGHEKRNSPTTNITSDIDTPGHGYFITPTSIFDPIDWRIPQNDGLWQGENGINNPCPAGYRVPTIVEWYDERSSWSSFNSAGAFASPLKLPVAGARAHMGYLGYVGSKGYYWSSSTVFRAGIDGASNLFFSDEYGSQDYPDRANGFSVRCIKN